jgi:hypothetical protein
VLEFIIHIQQFFVVNKTIPNTPFHPWSSKLFLNFKTLPPLVHFLLKDFRIHLSICGQIYSKAFPNLSSILHPFLNSFSKVVQSKHSICSIYRSDWPVFECEQKIVVESCLCLVPNVVYVSGLFILDCPSVFSIVYL